MHRFRKKSDARRSPHLNFDFEHSFQASSESSQQDDLPALPPASDFRTSLILPDLTRRFSVLRNSSGEPIGLDDLKHKFAEQRARGSENFVSEEEEDMILEALGRIHARTRTRGGEGRNSGNGESLFTVSDSQDGNVRTSASLGQSVHSTGTSNVSALHNSISSASLTSSTKGSQYSRRMSNNLFGSGKFRDYTYIRNTRRGGESIRTSTVTQSESIDSMNTIPSSKVQYETSLYSDSQSPRPSTPDGSAYSPSNSVTSSPNRQIDTQDDDTSIGSRFTRTMSPENLRHASLALDEAIRELEEEGDDEIVMERSPINRTPSSRLINESELNGGSPQISHPEFDAGTALSSDMPIVSGENQHNSSYSHSRTTSPTPRLPGYIPGMPRPMTPHDVSVDSDDQTPSATPRATSPRLPSMLPQSPTLVQTFASSLQRSPSSASTARQLTPRPISPSLAATIPPSTSPLFLSRSTNGRFTPEDPARSSSTSPGPEGVDSPVLGRRRPTSPLSAPAFQPLATMSSSRPGTPSNISWNSPSSPMRATHAKNMSVQSIQSGHSRTGSSASIGAAPFETPARQDDLERSKSVTRSLRSPALPDSPWIDQGVQEVILDPRAQSAMSNFELNSSRGPSRSAQSPTPTHSPISPTFSENGSSTAVNGVSSKHSSRGHNTFPFGSTHALLLSPLGNSSRSSLESAGSSYHSWDEDHKKDRLFTLISHLDPDQTEWHDISTDKSSPSTSGTSTSPYESTTESEAIIKREIGLSRNDFSAIQDKLVAAALAKAATPDSRHRAPSLRKRRPSTSQSNYSFNGGDSRVASPAPQVQQAQSSGPSSPRPSTNDHIAKASALLDSVVDSIQSPRTDISGLPGSTTLQVSTQISTSAQSTDPSPTARHRALADALFGVQDRDATPAPHVDPLPAEPSAVSEKLQAADMTRQRSQSRSESTMNRPLGTPKPSPSMPNVASPYAPVQSPSVTSSAHGHSQMDQSSLALEVQRRAEAATLALRKSPSNHKITEAFGSTRRRISPNQISSPKLMSASTSVDTIPLRPTTANSQTQPSVSSSSKLGSRFRKLAGTLRSKPQVAGEEITPFPMDLKTPPSAQTLTYSPSQLVTRGEATAASATEFSRFETSVASVPSPPASAGPGLKGFMSRFRKNRVVEPDRRPYPPPSATSLSASSPSSSASSPPASYVHSAPATKSTFNTRSSRPMTPQPQSFSPEPPIPEDAVAPTDSVRQNDAMKQLFDAAGRIGLDQAALSDLIARSPSTSSRSTAFTTMIGRSNSVADTRKSRRNSPHSPILAETRPSVDTTARPSAEIRQLNIRKNTDLFPRARQESKTPVSTPSPKEPSANMASMVIRRTIILPSDPRMSNVEWGTLMRKQSTSRRRRSAGAGSTQSKGSVQDRAPTPPPNRSTLKRFSSDSSPPVPHLPTFASHLDPLSSGQIEKSSSAYDSLYDMYGDVRTSDPPGPSGSQAYQGDGTHDGIPAVEVVELANGETIWSIVNGLRDDDAESYFGGDRASFASEYSVRDEGVKLFFKEHGRKSSKGSNNSLLGRKKAQGANRPETKVFYSSSAQIGRLIENISRGIDSGSFNIAPEQQQMLVPPAVAHSASSSVGSDFDMRWTVEERLEHMLGKMEVDP